MPSLIRPRVTALVAAALCTFGFWFVAALALTPPPIHSIGALHDWLATRSTLEASFAAVCAVAMGVAGALTIVLGLGLVADLAELQWLGALVRHLTPRRLRPLAGVALGAGLMAATAAALTPRERAIAPPAQMVEPGRDEASMYLIVSADSTIGSPPSETAPTTISAAPTTTSLPPRPETVTPTVTATPTSSSDASSPNPPGEPTWTIRPGEHLWLVAAETLHDHFRRIPTDTEIVPYWRALIALNRDRLVDPRQPDYVYSGQVFVLPALPADTGTARRGQ